MTNDEIKRRLIKKDARYARIWGDVTFTEAPVGEILKSAPKPCGCKGKPKPPQQQGKLFG